MPTITPAFIPTDSKTVYKVCIDGQDPFKAPKAGPGRPVTPFQGGTSVCLMEMEPLPNKSYNFLEPLQRPALLLEHNAAQVTEAISTCRLSQHPYVCALVMLAWYFIDDDANIMFLSDKLNFAEVDVAVWAVLAVFRNTVALRDHLSRDALARYINCFHQLVGLLNTFNVVVTHRS